MRSFSSITQREIRLRIIEKLNNAAKQAKKREVQPQQVVKNGDGKSDECKKPDDKSVDENSIDGKSADEINICEK